MEGDILLSINDKIVRDLKHADVVQALKECQTDQEVIIKVQRYVANAANSKMRKFDDLYANSKRNGVNLSRSKTPTADLYSTRPKMVLPIRPKTPLIDTRVKTPIFLDDTDDENEHFRNGFPKLIDKITNKMNSLELLEGNHPIFSGSYDSTKVKPIYAGVERKMNFDNVYSSPNHINGDPMYIHQTHFIPHSKNCFCVICQDNNSVRRNSEYASSHYSIPPQMSEDVGRKLNEFLNDRRRQLSIYDSTRQNVVPNGFYDPVYSVNGQEDDNFITEVTLERQENGFGFRIVGGTEEGSQVTVGHIIPDGAAYNDGRIATGDEILMINGIRVVSIVVDTIRWKIKMMLNHFYFSQ